MALLNRQEESDFIIDFNKLSKGIYISNNTLESGDDSIMLVFYINIDKIEDE